MPHSNCARALRASLSTIGIITIFGTAPVLAQSSTLGQSGKTVITTGSSAVERALSSSDQNTAKSRLPMLKSLSQIPGMSGRISQGFGSERHPFTTKGAYGKSKNGTPVTMYPWRPTGKLYMKFGSTTFVCTASVIEKGILVTAAHCVQDYGLGAGGSADSVFFRPALHGGKARYGTWRATAWVVPEVYANGTDNCEVSGVVCDNDIALVVLKTGPAPYQSKEIGQVVGRYSYYEKNQGFSNFLGKKATQITQLGYPVDFDKGRKMIRTDTLGYQETPNNIIIGSDQTGGSSGGPWLMNFGLDPISASSAPSFNSPNRVVATTSWGFVSDAIKVQGGSRFNNNGAYPAPGPTNIRQLLNDTCALYPAKCY
jgi:V8-like Glu-specific endopeptidase